LSRRLKTITAPYTRRVSQIWIAFFADVQLRLALSRLPASRLRPEITAHVSTLSEAMRIFQRQQKSKSEGGLHNRKLERFANPHTECVTVDALGNVGTQIDVILFAQLKPQSATTYGQELAALH
jgi:hypothetical protein